MTGTTGLFLVIYLTFQQSYELFHGKQPVTGLPTLASLIKTHTIDDIQVQLTHTTSNFSSRFFIQLNYDHRFFFSQLLNSWFNFSW